MLMKMDGQILVITISSTREVQFIMEDQRSNLERTQEDIILDLSEFVFLEDENSQESSSNHLSDYA